ncbi:hypothetical protein PIB30_066441 [Stylosanthes scabra]|uniref:Uncharacterized protein n=1 Tax=Stylosanthes scabra TaxID=79078 RepID=A0ABU6YMU5_9FABA|nr:hypothetical protein [Stylosanthes scabra]
MDNENIKSACGTQIPGRCDEVISQKEKNSHPPSCGTRSTMINLDSDDDNREITTPLSMMVASGIGTITPTEPADDMGRASQPLETQTITRNLLHTPTAVGGRAKRPRLAMVARSGLIRSAQNRKFKVTLAMDFSREDRKIFEYIFDESFIAHTRYIHHVYGGAGCVDLHGNGEIKRAGHYMVATTLFHEIRRKVFVADPSPEGIGFSQRHEMASIIQGKLADVVEKLADYPFIPESSGAWVMDWMLIGSDFTGIIAEYAMVDGNKARACMAVYLVRSPFNRFRRIIARWAEEMAEKKRTLT